MKNKLKQIYVFSSENKLGTRVRFRKGLHIPMDGWTDGLTDMDSWTRGLILNIQANMLYDIQKEP